MSAQPEKRMEQDAFIRVREVVICDPGAMYWNKMTPELKRKYFLPYWNDERIRRYLEMLKAFGFNSIQILAIPITAPYVDADQLDWHRRVVLCAQIARELGMTVSQIIWGSTVVNILQTKPKWKTLDWHQPEDRACLEAWYRNQAELAPCVDRVVTHWADPGEPGCKDCTIDTAIEMHNAIMATFREINPKIRGAFSTWFLYPGKIWPKYEGVGPLAASATLDRDTDIAIGLMNYGADGVNLDFAGDLKEADLDAIAAAGRRAAIWGWYTADVEILPALHVHTDLLQNYFRSLPPRTRVVLAWHSLDAHSHGLNMQNLYVAGRLMQDPSLNAQELLDEFVRGFVGETNALAVAAALRAVERVRTRSRRYEVEVGYPTNCLHANTEKQPHLPPTWLDESAAAVAAALRGLETVEMPPGFKPAWPVTLEPTEYLEELKAHLEAIRQMLAFLKGVEKVERMKSRGAPTDKLKATIDALPKVVYDPAHTAGLEAMIYKKKLDALNNKPDKIQFLRD